MMMSSGMVGTVKRAPIMVGKMITTGGVTVILRQMAIFENHGDIFAGSSCGNLCKETAG